MNNIKYPTYSQYYEIRCCLVNGIFHTPIDIFTHDLELQYNGMKMTVEKYQEVVKQIYDERS